MDPLCTVPLLFPVWDQISVLEQKAQVRAPDPYQDQDQGLARVGNSFLLWG